MGELNPQSNVFQPFASPPRTMPDIGQLSFSDSDSNKSFRGSRRTVQVLGSSTPNINRSIGADHRSQTPALSTSTRTFASTSTATSFSPITPRTPFTKSTSGSNLNFTPTKEAKSHPDHVENKPIRPILQYGFDWVKPRAEQIGRYLMIKDLPRDIDTNHIKQLVTSIAVYKVIIVKQLSSKGSVFVVFYDPREALKVYEYLHAHSVCLEEGSRRSSLHCMSIKEDVVDQIAERGEDWDEYWSDRESSIVIEILGGGPSNVVNVANCLTSAVNVPEWAETRSVEAVGLGGRMFIADFWDTRGPSKAIEALNFDFANGQSIRCQYKSQIKIFSGNQEPRGMRRAISGPAEFTLGSAISGGNGQTASLFGTTGASNLKKDLFRPTSDLYDPRSPRSPATESPSNDYLMMRSRQSSVGNETLFSATPAYASSRIAHSLFTSDRTVGSEYTPRSVNMPNIPRYGVFDKQAIPANNLVVPEHVAEGLDYRTTIMVKDVPNKLSRQELVDILQQVVPGGFDFVYLRFDFSNACNVGYAFVNFIDLRSLYAFIDARVGKRWNLFSSEKVLQICYADIQGKERLINKFRNSDVMTAPEQWRPQIFYSNGRLRGQTEPFPEPDHPNARARSGLSRYASHPTANGAGNFDDSTAYNYTSVDFDSNYGL